MIYDVSAVGGLIQKRVLISGLVVRPELNGTYGWTSAYDIPTRQFVVVLEHPDPKMREIFGRYDIFGYKCSHGSANMLLAKAANLTAIQPKPVETAKERNERRDEFCWACGTEVVDLKECAGCGQVHYCSRACQKAHWKEHKERCRQNQEEHQERCKLKEEMRVAKRRMKAGIIRFDPNAVVETLGLPSHFTHEEGDEIFDRELVRKFLNLEELIKGAQSSFDGPQTDLTRVCLAKFLPGLEDNCELVFAKCEPGRKSLLSEEEALARSN